MHDSTLSRKSKLSTTVFSVLKALILVTFIKLQVVSTTAASSPQVYNLDNTYIAGVKSVYLNGMIKLSWQSFDSDDFTAIKIVERTNNGSSDIATLSNTATSYNWSLGNSSTLGDTKTVDVIVMNGTQTMQSLSYTFEYTQKIQITQIDNTSDQFIRFRVDYLYSAEELKLLDSPHQIAWNGATNTSMGSQVSGSDSHIYSFKAYPGERVNVGVQLTQGTGNEQTTETFTQQLTCAPLQKPHSFVADINHVDRIINLSWNGISDVPASKISYRLSKEGTGDLFTRNVKNHRDNLARHNSNLVRYQLRVVATNVESDFSTAPAEIVSNSINLLAVFNPRLRSADQHITNVRVIPTDNGMRLGWDKTRYFQLLRVSVKSGMPSYRIANLNSLTNRLNWTPSTQLINGRDYVLEFEIIRNSQVRQTVVAVFNYQKRSKVYQTNPIEETRINYCAKNYYNANELALLDQTTQEAWNQDAEQTIGDNTQEWSAIQSYSVTAYPNATVQVGAKMRGTASNNVTVTADMRTAKIKAVNGTGSSVDVANENATINWEKTTGIDAQNCEFSVSKINTRTQETVWQKTFTGTTTTYEGASEKDDVYKYILKQRYKIATASDITSTADNIESDPVEIYVKEKTGTYIRVPVSADAHVRNSYFYSNYGADPYPRIRRSSSGKRIFYYNKIDLSNVTTRVIGAEFVLNSSHKRVFAGEPSINLSFVENDSWNENTINWSNKPTASTQIAAREGYIGQYKFDITNILKEQLKGDQQISLQVHPGNSGSFYVAFYSRENYRTNLRPHVLLETRNRRYIHFSPIADRTNLSPIELNASSSASSATISYELLQGDGYIHNSNLIPITAGQFRVCAKVSDPEGNVIDFICHTFTVTTGSTTLPVTADAFINDGNKQNQNFGTEPTLIVKRDNLGYNRVTYLKFALNDLTNIGKARLRLHKNNTNTNTPVLNVYLAVNDDWKETGENSITWRNQPTINSLAATLNPVSGYYEADITPQALIGKSKNDTISFRLVTSGWGNNSLMSFHSKESTDENLRPKLIVEQIADLAIQFNNLQETIELDPVQLSTTSSITGMSINYEVVSGPAQISNNQLVPLSKGVAVVKATGTVAGIDSTFTAYKKVVINPTSSSLLPSDDTFVNAGSRENNNYGSDQFLLTKRAGWSYTRRTFLKFNLESQTQEIAVAKLRLRQANDHIAGTWGNLAAYFIENDNWQESTTTWHSQPAFGTEIESHTDYEDYVEWDVTNHAQIESNGNNLLSVGVYTPSYNHADFFKFYSKETSNPALRPELLLIPISGNVTFPELFVTSSTSSIILNATTSVAGASIQYEVLKGDATIDDGVLTINGEGQVIVRAKSVGGNSTIADVKTQVVQLVEFNFPEIADRNTLESFQLQGSTNIDGATIVYTVEAGNATIENNTLTPGGDGEITVNGKVTFNDETISEVISHTFSVNTLSPRSASLSGFDKNSKNDKFFIAPTFANKGTVIQGYYTTDDLGVFEVQVMSLNGKPMSRERVKNKEFKINTHNLSSGIYLVSILKNGQPIHTERINIK